MTKTTKTTTAATTHTARTFEIGNTTFTLENTDGYTQLRSTGKHWAIRDTDGTWQVFKQEHYRMRLGCLTPEQVAEKLAACDEAFRELLNDLEIKPA